MQNSSTLKFHEPGLAPLLDASGAYHVDTEGQAAYLNRHIRTFGFYDGRAAVHSFRGWYHILPDGTPLYADRFAWCGNFQQNHATVKDFNGRYFHINQEGQRAYSSSFKYAGDFRDGSAAVQDDHDLYTHIDFNGKPLHDKKFLSLDVFHKGYARAQDKKGWFHINEQGVAPYPDRYKTIEPFYNGIARVETHMGALFLINERGEKIGTLRDALEDEFHHVSAELVSYWKFYTLDAACELKLFDHLPNTLDALSEKISIPPSSTEKLLRALGEMGYVEFQDEWHLSRKGDYLTSNHPFSLIGAQKLWKEEHLTSWRHLLYSLKTETSAFQHLFGASWFDYLKNEDEKNKLYHLALSTYAKRDYKTLSSRLDLGQHRSIVDVGGSSGTLIFELLNGNPHLQGMILDLPTVISLIHVPLHLKDRLQLISADFFGYWPSFQADSAILARVLHDWSDQNCVEILKKIHQTLSDNPNNRLYMIENIYNRSLLDLNMLVMTEGKERTLECFEKLLTRAGFALESICPLNEVSTILTAKKENIS